MSENETAMYIQLADFSGSASEASEINIVGPFPSYRDAQVAIDKVSELVPEDCMARVINLSEATISPEKFLAAKTEEEVMELATGWR